MHIEEKGAFSVAETNDMTKILLVDDENLILYSLSATLRRDGAEVTAVSNGKDALHEIHRSCFDICFLDVHLPDANGLDLMNIVQKVSPSTRVIIMTALDLTKEQLADLRHNACNFLPKPFDRDHVRSLVRDLTKNGSAAETDPLPVNS